MGNKELIQSKREQIAKLKAEIAELSCPSIGSMITVDTLVPFEYENNDKRLNPCSFGLDSPMNKIVGLSMEVFRHRVEGEDRQTRLLQRNMTDKQKRTAAKFCDEVTEIYNKYMIAEYGEEYTVYEK